MRYIFITGMGRSGSTFLASLLEELKDVHAGHEITGQREFWLLSWYLAETAYPSEYLQRKKSEIELSVNKSYYIDVSPYLQFATDELRKTFQPESILHLVRHPKEVIRSIYTRRNDADIHLVPKENKEIQRWLGADRFEQICWNWKHAVEYLLAKNIPVIRIEDLIEDYVYFSENLLKPFGFILSQADWNRLKNRKVNKTHGVLYRFLYARLKGKDFQADELPDYLEWPDKYKKIFLEYCSPSMKQLGYSV